MLQIDDAGDAAGGRGGARAAAGYRAGRDGYRAGGGTERRAGTAFAAEDAVRARVPLACGTAVTAGRETADDRDSGRCGRIGVMSKQQDSIPVFPLVRRQLQRGARQGRTARPRTRPVMAAWHLASEVLRTSLAIVTGC